MTAPTSTPSPIETQLRAILARRSPGTSRALLTGTLGWCPAYTLFGISTCPVRN